MPALVLDIKTTTYGTGIKFTIQIVEQRLRGGRASFMASNGFHFNSLSCPAIGAGYNATDTPSNGMIYLRGSARRNDNDVMYTRSVGYVEKLKVAVIEYNIAKEDVT